MDGNLVAILDSVGLDVVEVASTLDDSDTGFGVASGYQYNDHLALEFAYVDLGSVAYRAFATVSDGVDEADADVGTDDVTGDADRCRVCIVGAAAFETDNT